VTYILAAQLHDELTGDSAFGRYQEYLASVREHMPPSAYALATSSWYFDNRDHRAPHDAWLETASVVERFDPDEPKRRTVAVELRLLGAYHDGYIELSYRDVSRYRIDLSPREKDSRRGHRDWRYDEFRLASHGRVEHEIEWWGIRQTGNWLIEAADVEYRWQPAAQSASHLADA
jgi:hypothetical protein